MKVWIDQDLCTGDGLCEEIAPDVFDRAAEGNSEGAEGVASFPDNQLDIVVESAEECPGECIFIEP